MSDVYERALAEHGLRDLQPLYRRLLRKLKTVDPAAYDDAVARYRDEVEGAVEEGEGDPIEVWLAYGAWLAPRLAPGTLLRIAENGRAEPAPSPPPAGPMLIHLPKDARQRGFVLAMPAAASPAQRETAALLCE